jgi:hypothetical protein
VYTPLSSSMLCSNHTYVVYSPFCLYLWHGSNVDLSRRKGSLHTLKSFLNSRLYESINYHQSYLDKDMNIGNLKFRVEHQNSESQRFRSFFDSNASSGQKSQGGYKAWLNEDRVDYVMMSLRKQ